MIIPKHHAHFHYVEVNSGKQNSFHILHHYTDKSWVANSECWVANPEPLKATVDGRLQTYKHDMLAGKHYNLALHYTIVLACKP